MYERDARIAALAAAHDNVVSRALLERTGVSNRYITLKIARRVWQVLQAGVFLHGAALPTWHQRVRAAHYAAGSDSMVPGACALALRGANGIDDPPIEITVPDNRELDLRGVTVHRSRRGLGPTRWVDGIRVSSVERALLDFAAEATPLQVECAVESMLNKKLTAELQLWRGLIEHGGRGVKGTRKLRRVLMRRPDGRPAKSVLEILLGHELDNVGLGGIRNHAVTAEGKNYEIDRAFPESMVALEADSKAWHGTRTQSDKDKARQAALERAGWFFVRTDWTEVVVDPESLIARLRDAFGRAAA